MLMLHDANEAVRRMAAFMAPRVGDKEADEYAEEIEATIRADERARVEREIVEWIRHVVACGDGTEAFAGIFAVYRLETANKIADTIERGEYRKEDTNG